MADIILTLSQLETIFYTLTCQLLGLNPEDESSFNKVRVSWQLNGSPGWTITDDVVFLRITTSSDLYTQQRDVTYNGTNKTTSYTRVHSVHWLLYGPNSYENANFIRDALYDADLGANNLYPILNIPPPIRAPELFSGRWWERSDFVASFNEKVMRQGTISTIESVNIQIKTEEGGN